MCATAANELQLSIADGSSVLLFRDSKQGHYILITKILRILFGKSWQTFIGIKHNAIKYLAGSIISVIKSE